MHPKTLCNVEPSPDQAAVEALYAMGHDLFSQERFKEAAAVFRIMLQVAPTDERSWLGLGQCHEGLRQFEVALELYGAGTVANEAAARCELARARLFRHQGLSVEADEAFELAAEIAERTDDDALSAQIAEERRAS